MAARKTQSGPERLSRRVQAAVPAQVRARAAEGIEAQKGSLVRELQGVANVLRSATEQLEENDQPTVARYVQRAADAVERASDALDRKTLTQIGSDLGRVCRERPVLVGAAAALAGFVAARYVRNAAASGGVGSKSSAAAARRSVARTA